MPLYEYKCTQCAHRFEVQQKLADEPVKTCPKCHGKVNKVFSAAGIVFKGSGFHNTDYGKHGHKDKVSGETKKADKATKPKKTPG